MFCHFVLAEEARARRAKRSIVGLIIGPVSLTKIKSFNSCLSRRIAQLLCLHLEARSPLFVFTYTPLTAQWGKNFLMIFKRQTVNC